MQRQGDVQIKVTGGKQAKFPPSLTWTSSPPLPHLDVFPSPRLTWTSSTVRAIRPRDSSVGDSPSTPWWG